MWPAISLIGAAENEILSLNIEDWDLTSFFDYGTSPLTTAVKNILNLNMSFTFIPKYTVLKADLSKEGSVYIMVQNATDASFYIFPSKYPNSPHYKMVPTELQIQGCDQYSKCEEVMECERAVVDISDTNLDENVVFISWKRFETETLVILMQYKDKFIKCRHHNPHIQIQKLVMYGSQLQLFGIIDGFFRSTTQENNNLKLNRSFNLQVNQSVSLHTFQCLHCNTSIKLTCDNNLEKVVNVSSSQGSKLIFSDSLLVNGWKEFSLSNCGTQEFRNCNLTIQTLLQPANGQVNHIWIIAQGAVLVHLKNKTDNIYEGGELTCLEGQDTTVEDFEQTPTSIITHTSGTKFEFNANNTQCNQTLANYIIKNITNTLRTTTTSSQTDSWLIVVITFTIVNLVISAINFYKQCKMDKQKKEPIPPIVEYTVGEEEEGDTLL
jgi:hypothetical protein